MEVKAASGCRTPKPRGRNRAWENALASWSAAALCRFRRCPLWRPHLHLLASHSLRRRKILNARDEIKIQRGGRVHDCGLSRERKNVQRAAVLVERHRAGNNSN